ncbi:MULTISPECIES: hypothetical protein [unclassified Paenibacillus]|uniref:hypothetical protein n=1 Tax=unclassified Paenibacillus TaxID=185978 RepID=UPI001AE598CD|nr:MULTISPECIES: hypothetical protein [unclassified Paenibacillus]MBP1157335.1 hypothetical protein [Paenibacillus sp. PvP091]MBP1171927.1 hypothetical protein [Paenibacillus sp. PvR098]MBP2438308.1 hypothetical protein [Paenibacillus sp. PvP052]
MERIPKILLGTMVVACIACIGISINIKEVYAYKPLSKQELGKHMTQEQKTMMEFQKNYLSVIDQKFGAFSQDTRLANYGSIHIERENGKPKIVLSISKDDDVSKSLVQEIKQIVPSDVLKIRKVKHSKSDLKGNNHDWKIMCI